MAIFRDITMDDLQDHLHMTGLPIDFLCAVTQRASELLENAPKPTPKKPKTLTILLSPPKRSDTLENARKSSPQTPPNPSKKPKTLTIRLSPPKQSDSLENAQKSTPESPPNPSKKPKTLTKRPQREENENEDENPLSEAPSPKRIRVPQKPPLPLEFANSIASIFHSKNLPPTAANLVIQKDLFSTDLSKSHNRFSIPFSRIEHDFLTPDEKALLLEEDEDEKKRKFIEVKMVDPSLGEETVKLARWDMKKATGKTSSMYVLRGRWNAVVKKNELKERMPMQLWSFRVGGELRLALVRVQRNGA